MEERRALGDKAVVDFDIEEHHMARKCHVI